MARYTAQVWTSNDHPYDVEVNATSVFHARRIITRREGVKDHEVNRIFEIRDDDTSSSSSSSSGSSFDGGDMGGYLALGAVLFALWLIVEYWWIVIPIGVIGLIGWIYMHFFAD